MSEDAETLLANLPADGGTVGNLALQRVLGWDNDRYFAARNEVEDEGLLVRGRGRGGTVRRTPGPDAAEIAPDEVVAEFAEALGRELDLYAPMRDVIATDWARDRRSEPLAAEITAQQGRRATGGLWTRPDIVSVEVRAFRYLPGRYLDVVTFEVKPGNALNVQAIYEALAHRRAATQAYVLVHVPPDQEHELEPVLAEVAEVARSHGIGLVTASEPGDYQTWDERVAAERVQPEDLARLDNFIATQLSEQTRDEIIRRLR